MRIMQMIVSGSEIATLNECEMKYVYQFVLSLWPRDNSDAIAMGLAGHMNCQQFFQAIQAGKTKQEALECIVPVAMSSIAFKAASLASKFCSEWNVDSGKPLLVEEKVIVDLEGRIKIGLTPDLVWQFNSGKIIIIDFKFTGRSWSDEASELHYQLPSYKQHLKKIGIIATDLWYVFFNTRENKDNIDKYKIKKFTVTDKEGAEVVRDQIKSLDTLIGFRESPVAWSRSTARRVNKVYTCDYCPFKWPCRLGRKGLEKQEQDALALMFTLNTYGYGEDFDD
jgi:hypothetical protein